MPQMLRIYFLAVLCLVTLDSAKAMPFNPHSDFYKIRGHNLERQLQVLAMVSGNDLGGTRENDLQAMIEHFSSIPAVEEVNEGVILTLGRLLGIKTNPSHEVALLKNGMERWEHDEMMSSTQEIRAKYCEGPTGEVIPFCRKKLQSDQ